MTEPLAFSPSGDLIEPCGFAARCGRPLGHRGHHGGWRTGVTAIPEHPVPRQPIDTARYLGAELTPTELAVLGEWFVHGHYRAVAACRGCAEQTVKNHAASIQVKTGAESLGHAAHLLGWVSVPPGLGHQEEAS